MAQTQAAPVSYALELLHENELGRVFRDPLRNAVAVEIENQINFFQPDDFEAFAQLIAGAREATQPVVAKVIPFVGRPS